MTRDSETATGWTLGGVRIFAALLVTLQVIQGLSDPIPIGNVRFTESYYLVTYNHGFIRRGLLGEGMHLVFGLPTRSEVDVTADVVVALAIGAVLLTMELLIRRASPRSCAMALLLAASPFTIDFFLVDRRPDLLALALLVALGLVLTRPARAVLPGLIAIGIGFGAMVLVHEDVILVEVPWAIVLVVMATVQQDGSPGADRNRVGRASVRLRLGVLLGPPVLATLTVLAYGLPSSKQVAELRADVSSLHFTGNTVFTYLPESIGTSMRLVGSIPTSAKAWTLLLGLVLIALQLAWTVAWVRPGFGNVLARSGHQLIGVLMVATIVIATVILFATGFDWVRWFADCGAAWLIVQAFCCLLPGASGGDGDLEATDLGRQPERHLAATYEASISRIHLSHWLPALAVYLAAIPPLDDLFITDQLRHFLFFI
jgi:hypothetical protein